MKTKINGQRKFENKKKLQNYNNKNENSFQAWHIYFRSEKNTFNIIQKRKTKNDSVYIYE